MRAPLVLAFLLLVPIAPALSPQLPHATVSRGAEPDIHVSASGVVLVGDTAGLHRSVNGGASWTTASDFSLPGFFTDGWPIAEDAAGTIYSATTQGQVVAVGASRDGGRTWSQTSPAISAAAVADRPWIAAKGDGEVVVVYYSALLGEQCLYSDDGGVTFLSRTTTNEGFSNAGNAILDDEGRVWYTNGRYLVRWGARCEGEPQKAWIGPSGAQIFAQLAVVGDDAFTARPPVGNGQMALTGIHGMDVANAKTLVVSSNALKSNTFAAIASRGDGEIAIAWYASANAGNPAGSFTGSWDVYVARVRGFWSATPDVTLDKLTTVPNHVGGFCMSGISCTSDRDLLDYMGVAYDATGNVHVAYGHDGAGSNADVRYATLPAL